MKTFEHIENLEYVDSFEMLLAHCQTGVAQALLIDNMDWQAHNWAADNHLNTIAFGDKDEEIIQQAIQDAEAFLFRETCFKQVSFRGIALSGLAFYQCDFYNCHFDSADLKEVVFGHCNFYVSDRGDEDSEEKIASTFKFASLIATKMIHCDISLCDFSRANLYRAEIRNCQGQGGNFSDCTASYSPGGAVMLNDATLVDNNFAYADFSGASLKDAELSGNRLSHCLLHDCCFENSLLTECDFHAVETSSLILAGADLRGSNISGLDPRQVDFTGAMINASQQPMLLESLGLLIAD